MRFQSIGVIFRKKTVLKFWKICFLLLQLITVFFLQYYETLTIMQRENSIILTKTETNLITVLYYSANDKVSISMFKLPFM